MNKIICFLILSLVLGYLKTEAQTSKLADPPDKKLMREINDAWATLDPENAAKYYDKSSDNVFYDVSPFEYRGWKSYSTGASETLKTLVSMKCTVGEDAAVRIDGKTAWGTATLNIESTDSKGIQSSMDYRWTVIWEKKGTNWLIVHEHLSVPASTN